MTELLLVRIRFLNCQPLFVKRCSWKPHVVESRDNCIHKVPQGRFKRVPRQNCVSTSEKLDLGVGHVERFPPGPDVFPDRRETE